ncbi:unnamed protein product [Pedinophyceae sp. YPF-701]|nr:unnamed protein product [Pedinophyceae sp. YPF-701]
MDKLKSLLAAKKKETSEVRGDKKWMRKADLEAARLKRLREEEQRELAAKARKKPRLVDEVSEPSRSRDADAARRGGVARQRTPEEVIQRLRTLGQPATLFGEGHPERAERLRRVEKELDVDANDGEVHGKNIVLEIQREEEAQRRAEAAVRAQQRGADEDDKPGEDAPAAGGDAAPADPTAAAFAEAARALQERLEEERMEPEDLIAKYLRRWCDAWKEDMDARPEAVRNGPAGVQATNLFKQTMLFFRPLFERLERRELNAELMAGLYLMVEAMRQRHYLQAYDVYMKVTIGNAPWPIGVTQVGLHERAGREKIRLGHKAASAHIMTDEATRKFLQGWKRLLTFVQRRWPTDPSRSVDFNAQTGDGWGAAGGGSMKQALIEAEQKGEKPDNKWAYKWAVENGAGKCSVPEKWEYTLKRAYAAMERRYETQAADAAGKTAGDA